ncbi:Inner membrane protein YabI [invertebrate metagenome]|uniref:Inner membrane protein YabI n=1 Tax=invertebrate metagenome TaxID=1711999 RepID=A0A2H9TB25_9ZZZZ
MSFLDFSTLQAWLLVHGEWIGPVTGFIALVESLAIVGYIVPGVPILFALGALAGAGAMSPVYLLLWGFLGAVIGDGLSYQLGYQFHHKVRKWWPFRQYPQWLQQGELFFQRHGDMSIALGRFIGPVRPVIPVVAGMMNMRPRRFYGVNILSAIPWSPVYLLPGFFVGKMTQLGNTPPSGLFSLLAVCAVLALLLSGIGLWLDRITHRRCIFPVLMGTLMQFLLLAAAIIEWQELWTPMNYKILYWVSGGCLPVVGSAMAWITGLGSLKWLWFPLIVGSLWCVYRGQSQRLVIGWSFFALLEIVIWFLKWGIGSTRPLSAQGVDPFSFPSGHAAQATFCWLWLVSELSLSCNSFYRWLLFSAAIIIALLVGFSRLYLGVHWGGDVIAGLLLGATVFSWLAAAQRLWRQSFYNTGYSDE